MRTALTCSLSFLVFLGITGCCTSSSARPPAAMRLENLLQQALSSELAPGREVIVSYVEIPPHTTMERHWHPGEEFQYYLEGEAEVRIDGEPPFIARPGRVGHIPYRKMHTAVTGEQGAKALVFRVHTAGEPVRVLEDGGAEDH